MFKYLPIAALLLVTTVVSAHHSIVAFDMTKGFTLTGTVDEFQFRNPHSYVYVKAPDITDPSITRVWKVEMDALNLLRRYGWSKETLHSGDKFTCHGARARDADVYAMKCFTAELEDGRTMPATPSGPPSGRQ